MEMSNVIVQTRTSSIGSVLNQTMVCQYTNLVTSNGIFFGDFPLNHTAPVMMVQIILIFIVTRITYFLLRPLRQTKIITQIIAGILLGPSLITRNQNLWLIFFPPGGKLILDTFASFGFVIHVFVLGVQTDVSLLKNLGRKPLLIGVSSLVFPWVFVGTAYKILTTFTSFNDNEAGQGISLSLTGTLMTSFVVITSLLTELNILNSELGRLAAYTSLMCDATVWIYSSLLSNVSFAVSNISVKPILGIFVLFIYYGSMVFILRPLVIHMVKNTPEGKPLKDGHFYTILVMVFGVAFFAEVFGQHAGLGAFILGLSLPDGHPLGSSLVQKLDTIASGLILPIFCTISGLRTNVYALKRGTWLITELLLILVYVSKLTGIVAASLYFEMPFYEALALALILCCKGVMDIGIFGVWLDSNVISDRLFALAILNMVIVTGLATLLVTYLYDPSRRYMAYKRRTIIQNSKKKKNLQILVCIHHEDNVPPIINLLEASNPTRGSPIFVFVLQLKELIGRATAVLTPHHQPTKGSTTFDTTHSDPIVNAFKYFENHSQESVSVQHFTAIAPYASMHDDICTIALDKSISIAILPFHKKWAIDGTVEKSFSAIRAVNQKVLNKCPCSVGVLIDRGQIGGNQPVLISQTNYRIAMLYLGGNDDQEALTYSRRMADHPNVTLKVIWIKKWCHDNEKSNSKENHEEDLMDDFKANAFGKERMSLKEENVRNGVETTKIIRSMENDFDLFIVGKHQDPDSVVISGLTDWSECPELGIIGDMLATSDFQFSVLVVQQPQGAVFLDHKDKAFLPR